MYLTRSKHIAHLLKWLDMEIVKPCSTLVIIGKSLLASYGVTMSIYRSAIGAL